MADRLVFSFQEAEASAYNKVVRARRDRGPDYFNFRALMAVITFAIGFAVLFAKHPGFVTSEEMPAVLLTAYAAFFAGGLAHRTAMQFRYRVIARAMFRDTATETFEITFDAGGVVYKCSNFDLRVPWTAIAEVVEAALVIVLLNAPSQGPSQGMPIPARLFSDPASRANFAAAIREYASAARRQ